MAETLHKLMIVDDDTGIQRQLRWGFDDYETVIAGDREEAIAAFRKEEPAVVTVDLGLPPDPDSPEEGLAVVSEILALRPETRVIVVTGQDDHQNALTAIRMGAYDFYHKPIILDDLSLIVGRAFHLYELEEELRSLQNRRDKAPLAGLIAGSTAMLNVCKQIERVAGSSATVLLLGESGTGKELLASSVHSLSERAGKPFSAINCAAIPETLLESELFGYEKGAFTGAVKQTKGKIELAEGGTLFLDEIGDVPLSLQVKLLRFLQERVIQRLGGSAPIPVDVRIVGATNQDLTSLMAEGKFREDLYYRLSELVINIPPLRDREGDVELLARSLLSKFSGENKRDFKGFTDDAISAMNAYHWPGNVRELENRIKRAVIMADGIKISADDLELAPGADIDGMINLARARELAERTEIGRALVRAEGNISRAAKLLGISRPTLYDLMRQHEISPDR